MALHLMPPPSWRRISLNYASNLGVLQYSVIESVILFCTTDELQIMMYGVIKASALHEEAIRVRT